MAATQQSLTDLAASGALDAAAVLNLRRAIYAKDGVTRADLLRLLDAGRAAGPDVCAEFSSLLAEAATDLLVRQSDPQGYVTAADADWLVDRLGDKGGLSSAAEFAMLVDVLRYAVSAPPTLTAFAVREVAKTILNGRRAAAGGTEPAAGVVTADDVATLHSLVFAPTEGSSLHVTRESAEALFDIAHATAGGQNDPAFDDFFAKAIGNYLMGVGFRWTPSAADARAREQWADRPVSFAEYFSKMVETPLAQRFGGALAETKSVEAIEEASFAAENAKDGDAIRKAADLSPSAADWVIAHLTTGAPLSSAERRLLNFLAKEAASMPPALRALAEKAD